MQKSLVNQVSVGPMYSTVFQCLNIDLSGHFRVMSQSLADDGDGHVEFVHDAGPGMAGDIGGEAHVLVQHGREQFQIVVVGA